VFYGMNSSWLVLMIVSTVLGLVTQGYVNSTYRKWSRVPLATGESGAQVARRILDADGLSSVGIEPIRGRLTDNYDPRSKRLHLSQDVYGGTSIASAGVAAHESGHALQDSQGYVWGRLRSALVPAASFGSRISIWLIIIGLIIGFTGLAWLGVAFFAAAVLFQIVTLPVEFDASRRAIAQLESTAGLPSEQVAGARAVLTAAALTYVAAALIAALQLLYFVGLARDN
jgi:Zn-dependent membrane protease YugP